VAPARNRGHTQAVVLGKNETNLPSRYDNSVTSLAESRDARRYPGAVNQEIFQRQRSFAPLEKGAATAAVNSAV
jgi:hypothetical protein